MAAVTILLLFLSGVFAGFTKEFTKSSEYRKTTTEDATAQDDEFFKGGLPTQGVIDGFLGLAKETRADGLPSSLELVFAVDGSRNVRPQDFHLQKQFVSDLARQFSISPSGTRIAVVSYGNQPTLEFDFNENVNRECTAKAIHRVRLQRGHPNPGSALEFIKERVFTQKFGARATARKGLFVILTGSPRNVGPKVNLVSKELKMRGVEMFILVVHRFMDPLGGSALASTPFRNHVFHVKEFQALENLAEAIKFKGFVSKCTDHGVVYDECHRRCVCRNGELVDCYRIRKEFTSMSLSERRRYIKALIKISSTSPFKKAYDRLTRVHPLFFNKVHILRYFFPWHRWYILIFENKLRQFDCRVTVPYWDWAKAVTDGRLWKGHHNRDFWNPGPHGFGGNGQAYSDCVTSGPFREEKWQLSPWLHNSCLKRSFDYSNQRTLHNSRFVQRIIRLPHHRFKRFEYLVRVELHNSFHNAVGGTMSLECSASAPEFWTHHAFLDKLWSDWQDRGAAYKFQYYRTVHGTLPGSTRFGWEFIDLRRQPLCVKVLYEK